MKVLVQNPETLLYLGPDGTWSEDIKKAQHYPSLAEAIHQGAKLADRFDVITKSWRGTFTLPVSSIRAAESR